MARKIALLLTCFTLVLVLGARSTNIKLAVLVLACSRPTHLRHTLRSLAGQDKILLEKVELYISIDSNPRSKLYVAFRRNRPLARVFQ